MQVLRSVLNEMQTMIVMVVLLLSLGHLQGLADDNIPGRPGRDYPVYDSIPPTLFSCFGQVEGGYYADPQAGCQVFHVCSARAGDVSGKLDKVTLGSLLWDTRGTISISD